MSCAISSRIGEICGLVRFHDAIPDRGYLRTQFGKRRTVHDARVILQGQLVVTLAIGLVGLDKDLRILRADYFCDLQGLEQADVVGEAQVGAEEPGPAQGRELHNKLDIRDPTPILLDIEAIGAFCAEL